MSDVELLQELHGLLAYDFPFPEEHSGPLPPADSVAWRIAIDPDAGHSAANSFPAVFERFLTTVNSAEVRSLIIGQWDTSMDQDSQVVVELLVAARERLTALRAVFIGDLTQVELSWIEQTDVTPVLNAYPALRELGVRGGTGLRFPAVRHNTLRTLSFETGGLPAEVVRGVGASELPALRYVEMWLGSREYGGDATVDDLIPVLSGKRFPRLRHLGLRNSEIQDEIATALASASVVPQLLSLDLSLGVLTDRGAEALLDGQSLTHLQWLDLHYHFISDKLAQRMREAWEPFGVEVDLSEPGEEYEDAGEVFRYPAVGD